MNIEILEWEGEGGRFLPIKPRMSDCATSVVHRLIGKGKSVGMSKEPTLTSAQINISLNKHNRRVSKLKRKTGCIPVVYGGWRR